MKSVCNLIGQLGAKEMGYGMDGKTKTVAMTMSAPAGKLSNGDTNVWNNNWSNKNVWNNN